MQFLIYSEISTLASCWSVWIYMMNDRNTPLKLHYGFLDLHFAYI